MFLYASVDSSRLRILRLWIGVEMDVLRVLVGVTYVWVCMCGNAWLGNFAAFMMVSLYGLDGSLRVWCSRVSVTK